MTRSKHTAKTSSPAEFSSASRTKPSIIRSELAYILIACGASALIGVFAIAWYSFWDAAHGQELPGRTSPLVLEEKIPLGSVAGRIDHMAIDVARRRLFVAELGNNSVSVVDLDSRKVLHRIGGLGEPQGIAYVSSTDTVFVANGGNGMVRIFHAADFSPAADVRLGDDADNVRFDRRTGRVLVGFGNGAIAVIDPKDNTKISESRLPAHPESFQIDPSSGRVFVNLPSAKSIAVLGSDLRSQKNWAVRYSGNFAMAVDPAGHRVLVAYRRPARLVTYDEHTGQPLTETETCGDADDLFYDPDALRIYVICGSGAVDVFDAASDKMSRTARVRTVSGARTGLFVPELNRLIVAVRRNGGQAPAIWVYRINR